ncbi:Hypothetical protein A7982_07839 [Minicystis rosea]|nr:Hypothetical protein A7982_07839 [Minicystis rosea]
MSLDDDVPSGDTSSALARQRQYPSLIVSGPDGSIELTCTQSST